MEENKNTEYWNGVKAERKNTRRFSALCGITALLVGGFVGFSVGKIVLKALLILTLKS